MRKDSSPCLCLHETFHKLTLEWLNTLLHSEQPKLHRVFAILSVIGLKYILYFFGYEMKVFHFQNNPKNSRSILQDESRIFGIFWKKKKESKS